MRTRTGCFRYRGGFSVFALAVALVGIGVAGVSVAAERGPASPQAGAEVSSACGTLAGTVVVEGGRSFALFRSGTGMRLVREGDEVAENVRLLEVRADGIVVRSEGHDLEIRLRGSADGSPAEGKPAGARQATRQESHGAAPAVTAAAVAREAGWLRARNADMVKARMDARRQRWTDRAAAQDAAKEVKK